MSPFIRIASMSVAVVTALELVVAIGLAPHAAAEPCTDPAANAVPGAVPAIPAPGPAVQPPTGHRPPGTNDNAPLPDIGALLAGAQNTVHQQAGVVPPAPAPEPQQPDPGAAPQPQPQPQAAEPAPAAPNPGAALGGARTSIINWVSGPHSPNSTLQRFGISGTDLGIMWDNGNPGNRQVLMAFGDTFGFCRVQGKQWRYNVLFRTQARDLSGGLAVPQGVPGNRFSGAPVYRSGIAKQVVNSIRWAPTEKGVIPTAGTSVGGVQYMNFMSIRNWGRDGEWSTNYSALAMSRDNGETWGILPTTIRTPEPGTTSKARHIPGNQNFQQGAFLQPGDGYVYSYGTPSGRGGPIFLSRVPQNALPDLRKYQYWSNSDWAAADPATATPIVPGPAGEMSVQYNDYLQQYLMLYTNGASNDVVARTSPTPQGPWSPESVLVRSPQIPGGIYAPFLHPWASGQDIYYNLSLWSAYNVILMHTKLG
ncbi:DUF4185 domain-containing protein [Mycobacterium koreense]|nr:DUF4185 domain-containing protein [Mycolicibacillus koreensis]BBY52884.1 hypothetical protein MKOR_01350 [Mycolicibacillus koreensis]